MKDNRARELNQFFSPKWATELVIERKFADLTRNDLVCEPSCGTGAFLAAIPTEIPAFGVEIDATLIPRAMAATGREIIHGDFREVAIPFQPTVIIGNPPFSSEVFDGMLDRAFVLLPDGARAGFILPAYMMQTPSRVCRYNERWSIEAELMPRTIWPRLSKPLVFCMFRKGQPRILIGFALYTECRDIESMRSEYRQLIREVSGSAWASAVATALANLGGAADLSTIYRAMETKRPTGNRWWKEKVRQVLQGKPFARIGEGRYSLPLQEAA